MTQLTSSQHAEFDDPWHCWRASNLAPRETFAAPWEQRDRLPGRTTWLIEPVHGASVELAQLRVDFVHWARPADHPVPLVLEVREGGPDGRLVRALECAAGNSIDGRNSPDRIKGGAFISVTGDPDETFKLSFTALYL